MKQRGPNADAIYPNPEIKSLVFVKNVIKRPSIQVGDFTYYSDEKHPEDFESRVTHHYEFLGDRLIIGKYCSIGSGIEFIMNGANHRMDSISAYPFNLFGHGWEASQPQMSDLPFKGDTVVGNDVWFGQNVTVMPGVRIGDGAIIAANTCVVKDVAPYSIVGGNPSRLLKYRFEKELIAYLLDLKWWDWPEEKVFANLNVICNVEPTIALFESI